MKNLQLSESRVSGARYYTINPNPNWDPYWYNQEWHVMENWCKNTYGSTPKDGVWTPGARWYANNSKFWFREEADMLMFILRWS